MGGWWAGASQYVCRALFAVLSALVGSLSVGAPVSPAVWRLVSSMRKRRRRKGRCCNLTLTEGEGMIKARWTYYPNPDTKHGLTLTLTLSAAPRAQLNRKLNRILTLTLTHTEQAPAVWWTRVWTTLYPRGQMRRTSCWRFMAWMHRQGRPITTAHRARLG